LGRLLAHASPRSIMKNRLRQLRMDHSLSQGQLADIANVSRQTINAIEADKYDPSLPLAYRLAAYFSIPVEQLFFNPFVGSEGASEAANRRLPE
jgi:putative transcriptional regulator